MKRIVLTGGASLLPGSVELAEKTLGLPVKVGLPVVKGGLAETVNSPVYATGVGLIQYALTRKSDGGAGDGEKTSFEKFFKKVKESMFIKSSPTEFANSSSLF